MKLPYSYKYEISIFTCILWASALTINDDDVRKSSYYGKKAQDNLLLLDILHDAHKLNIS